MIKPTNLLFAVAIPAIYTAFRYLHDDNFKNNVDHNLSKGKSFIRDKTSGLIGDDEESPCSSRRQQSSFIRDLVKEKYSNLKLDKSQINDISHLYESTMNDFHNEVEKVLTEKQKTILGESKQ